MTNAYFLAHIQSFMSHDPKFYFQSLRWPAYFMHLAHRLEKRGTVEDQYGTSNRGTRSKRWTRFAGLWNPQGKAPRRGWLHDTGGDSFSSPFPCSLFQLSPLWPFVRAEPSLHLHPIAMKSMFSLFKNGMLQEPGIAEKFIKEGRGYNLIGTAKHLPLNRTTSHLTDKTCWNSLVVQ